ncbi:MAG: hypothetical protein E7597_04510 [Ruminococcaceae bacterium]|nr:hypothetical protein [Oscillospiraceae bacterium]
MKKFVAVLMAIMMVLTVFVSCSKDEAPKKNTESNAPEASTNDSASADGSDEVSDISQNVENSNNGETSEEEPSFVVNSEVNEVSKDDESSTDADVSTGVAEYDSALFGSWSAEVEGSVLMFSFEDGGVGSMSAEGLTVDMAWFVSDGKLTMNMSYYGVEENIVTDADYSIVGNSLTITYENDPLTLTFVEDNGGEDSSAPVVPVEKEYDSILLGTWGYFEDGVALLITFEENGKGKIRTEGATLTIDWYTANEKLSATASVMGELFADAEYTVDVDKLFITVDGEVLVFAKDNTDNNTGNGNNTNTDESQVASTGRGYDSALLGSWVAVVDGTEMTFTFEEEGVGFVSTADATEIVSFYIDWYTENGILETTITEMDGVEINEPLASFEYEFTREGLALIVDGDAIIFTEA